MLLLAVTLLTLLTCASPVVHMMSTVLVIPLTIVAVHCNINGSYIVGLLLAVTSTVKTGSIYCMIINKFQSLKLIFLVATLVHT